MEEYTVQEGQCLMDIASEKYGTPEAVFDIVKANTGLEFQDAPSAGSVIALPEDVNVVEGVAKHLADRRINAANWNEPPTGDYNADDYDNDDYNT